VENILCYPKLDQALVIDFHRFSLDDDPVEERVADIERSLRGQGGMGLKRGRVNSSVALIYRLQRHRHTVPQRVT
jgi:hypothetical protein